MSVLRILRNVAVLVILAVAVLASTSGPAAAKKTKCRNVGYCLTAGRTCGGLVPCCCGLICVYGSGNSAYCRAPL